MEALFALVQKIFSESGNLHIGLVFNNIHQSQLKSNKVFAELTIKDTVFLFILDFSEDILNNGIQDEVINLILLNFIFWVRLFFRLLFRIVFFELMNIRIVFNTFFLALIPSFKALEKITSELYELVFKVVWGNNIQNKSDFLNLILLRSSFFLVFNGLLSQFDLFLVILLSLNFISWISGSLALVILALIESTSGSFTISIVIIWLSRLLNLFSIFKNISVN